MSQQTCYHQLPQKDAPGLNDMLTPEQAAAWFQLKSQRALLPLLKGRKPRVPSLRINRQIILISPRMVLARIGSDCGMSPELIAAAMGTTKEEGKNGSV